MRCRRSPEAGLRGFLLVRCLAEWAPCGRRESLVTRRSLKPRVWPSDIGHCSKKRPGPEAPWGGQPREVPLGFLGRKCPGHHPRPVSQVYFILVGSDLESSSS